MTDPALAAVFVSYAREDSEPACRIAEALRRHEIEVWLDRNELRGADAWDPKIRREIKECALFLPVVSANTQERREGYFRLEWKLAAERTHHMAEGVPFIAPVVIDDTAEANALVPAEFMRVQWTRLPGAKVTPEFAEQVKRLLAPVSAMETGRTAQAGKPRPVQRGEGAASPARRPVGHRVPAAAWGLALAGVLAVAVIVAVMMRKSPDAGAGTRPPTAENAASAALVVNDKSAAADKSIAVLPFTNLSDDKENTAFFSDGMHEDILTTLANIPELRVISRTSVMEYRNTTKKIPQIARELGVAYILEGSVRRAGNQIRLTGQLIRAAKDVHLWAKNYDRELTPKDMFAIQAALATEIAGALQAAISPAAKKLVERRPTENLAAYDLYLRARELNLIGSNLGPREKLLLQAVELDPNFAEAWGLLAVNHGSFILFDLENTPERLKLADAAIARAVRLAPDSPDVMIAFGSYALAAYRDFPRAVAQYEKVIRLQPNNSEAYRRLGAVQRRQGRWLESLVNFRKVAELDPGDLSHLRTTLFAGRRWEEGLAVHRRMIALKGEEPRRMWELARCIFAATGSTKELEEWAAQMIPEVRDSDWGALALRELALIKGDFLEWKRLDARGTTSNSGGLPAIEAMVDAALVFAAHGDMTGARARLGNERVSVRAAVEREPANERLRTALARMEALLGERAAAIPALGPATEGESGTPDAQQKWQRRYDLAVIHALRGDKAMAVAALAELLRLPNRSFDPFSVHTLRVDPAFANLRGDPRFEALLNDPKNHAPLF